MLMNSTYLLIWLAQPFYSKITLKGYAKGYSLDDDAAASSYSLATV